MIRFDATLEARGTQMLRIRKSGEMPCGYDAALWNFVFCARLRHNGISPRLCASEHMPGLYFIKPRTMLRHNRETAGLRSLEANEPSTESSRGVARAQTSRKIPSAGVVATPIRSKLCVRRSRLRSKSATSVRAKFCVSRKAICVPKQPLNFSYYEF